MEFVCIYNRCSTEEEQQVNALAIQAEESREIVQMNPEWKLVAQYVETQSGTTAKNRPEYQKMLAGIEAHCFTLIVIKSIDRLMRNAKDWYLFLDCITRNQVRLYMYLERKYYEADDSLLNGIKAILAEDFSRELSKKIKNAHKRRQEKKTGYNITREMFGWDKTGKDTYILNEEEAGWYRAAFGLAEAGYGYQRIAGILYEMGARSRSGGAISAVQWRNMLLSPRAHGTMTVRKSEYDFASKKRMEIPEEKQIIIEHALPEIITPEYHARILKILNHRASVYQKRNSLKMTAGRYDLSGKLICGICNKPYYHVGKSGKSQTGIWKCSTYLGHGSNIQQGGCRNRYVKQSTVYNKLTKDLTEEQTEIIAKQVIELFRKTWNRKMRQKNMKGTKQLIAQKKQRKDLLLEKYLAGIVSQEDYQRYAKKLENEILQLENEKTQEEKEADFLQQISDGLRYGEIIRHAFARNSLENIDKIIVDPEGELKDFKRDD